jgi:hypothetical protein
MVSSTWNLRSIYKSDSDPAMDNDRKKIHSINYGFINKWKKRDDFLKDPKILKTALDELEIHSSRLG